MSSDRKAPPYLKLVDEAPVRQKLPEEISADRGWQRTLFAASNESLLCFIDLANSIESDFLRVILDGKPKHVLDLRLVPTFDLGSLSRKLVFDLLHQVSAKYIDVSGLLGVRERNDARLNPGVLVPKIAALIGSLEINGPIVVLVENSLSTEEYISSFTTHAQGWRPQGWELLVLPQAVSGSISKPLRRTIFISHANPEDNDFTRWLVTQLSLLGYEVWSDLTKVLGGSYFWTSIEDAIRNHAAKVVVVLSKSSQQKPGVLDEINCALSVERKERIEQFVVPVRIDDLPFDDVLANLARKNILDFSGGWLNGLDALCQTLDAARVPKTVVSESSISALWSSTTSSREVIPVPERLVSNWLRIINLPDQFSIGESARDSCDTDVSQPFLTFVGQPCMMRHVKLGMALRGELSTPEFRDVANITSSLLRQSWNLHAESLGLKSFELASKRLSWYVPAGLLAGDLVSFKAMDGKRRRKILVGRSAKRDVHWHYGVEMRPVIGNPCRFTLLSHIIFTKDGIDEVLPPERMHLHRRGFCKSWWNDRWRDLELAFLSWLSPTGSLRLHAGNEFQFVLDCRPVQFTSPVSLKPSASDAYDSLIADIEWDELDTDDVDDLVHSDEFPDEV